MIKGKLKQMISILLIAVMALSMTAPGFAEETTPKVTINSRTSGHTFEMYQIFSGDVDTNEKDDAVLTNVDWGASVKKDVLIDALYEAASNTNNTLYEVLKDISADVWSAATAQDATDDDKQAVAYAVAKALSSVGDKTTEAYAFADLVGQYSDTDGYLYLSDYAASTNVEYPYDDTSTEYANGYLYYYEMSGFASGYYILMDKEGSLGYTKDNTTLDTASYTRYILGVIGGEVVVNAKADTPTIDKYIVDPDDSENLEKTEEYSIGDNITYQLNSAVPNMEGYTSYWFMAEDTLCAGLDFIEMESVTVGGTDVPVAKSVYRTFDRSDTDYSDPLTEIFYKGSVKDENKVEVSSEDDIEVSAGTYTLYWYEFYNTQETDDTDDDVKTETKLYFVLNGFYDSYKNDVDDEILITYIVRLNENASIGETGNDNTVDLIYSNNPNDTYGGEPTPDTEKEPSGGIGKTTTKKTVSYTSLLKIKKVDTADESKSLAGATFKLTGVSSGITTYYILETSDEFEYVVSKEGMYVNANEFNTATDVKDWVDYDVNQYSEYTRYAKVPTDSTYKVTTQKEDNNVALTMLSGTTGSDGLVIFEGLGEGVYKLEETSAPTGYNKLTEYIYIKIEYLDPIGFEDATKTWTGDQPDTGDEARWSYKYIISDTDPTDADWEDANVYKECNMSDGVQVENASGIILPSTGGVGTVIFTAVGICVMAGAVVILYARRRREDEE